MWGSGIKCSLLELDLKNCTSPKDKNFRIVVLSQPSPTKSFLSGIILGFSNSCPRCLSLETTLHIICHCPWAKEFWLSLPKTRSLEFFSLDLQAWRGVNLTKHQLSNPSSIPWLFIFAQGIWQLWLAQNRRIFAPPSDSLNHLLHKTLNLSSEFFHIISPRKIKTSTCVKYIAWQPLSLLHH